MKQFRISRREFSKYTILAGTALAFSPKTLFADTPVPIHDYPYDSTVTSYPSSASWPLISAQGHWRPANSNPDTTLTPQLISPSIGHTHVEVYAPIYGEFADSFRVRFNIVLFHVDGTANGPYGYLLSDVIWDDGGGSITTGDPNGIVTRSGSILVNFMLSDPTSGSAENHIPQRGWFSGDFSARTSFTSGDRVDTTLFLPFYSVVSPAAPEEFLAQMTPGRMMTFVGPVLAHNDTQDAFGLFNVVQYSTYLPILSPLTTAVAQPMPFLYRYGSNVPMPNGTGMTRFGMDLHHGITGTLIQSLSDPAGVTLPSPFDPNILGSGLWKVAALWQQDTGVGAPGVTANEQVTALLVVNVTVGTATPPPPPPPPPPMWMTVGKSLSNEVIQQLMGTSQFRICTDSTLTTCGSIVSMID